MIKELNVSTKVSALVEEIIAGKNQAWVINGKYYVFDVNLNTLGNIVWTVFDAETTMGVESWMCRYGAATTVYTVLFMPSIKSQIDLKYVIMPAFPGNEIEVDGTITPQ